MYSSFSENLNADITNLENTEISFSSRLFSVFQLCYYFSICI